MTPESQRMAIAEACRIEPLVKFESVNGRYVKIEGSEDWTGCPDYLNDLNAMHEAEKAVIFKDVNLYLKCATHLQRVVGGSVDALFATATQRAEAFLRTLDLWQD